MSEAKDTSTPAAETPQAPAPIADVKADPAPVKAPQQETVPIAATAPDPPKATNPIPAMNNLRIADRFNRMDRDQRFVQHTVNIDAQNTLSGETYDQLQRIATTTLPITRDNFIRMWKTLFLKRTQDVYEQQYDTRPDHYVRVSRSITGPATLMDILHSIGQYFSPATGRLHFIEQPARAAQPENWWTVEATVLRDWTATIRYMEKSYVMKEYPSQRETEARPIVLTYRLDVGALMQIKALTNEPRLSDAYLRMVNDDLFAQHARFTVANCALNMTAPLRPTTIRGQYIAGYVTRYNI